jgi:PAS domain S-box-containing protein
MNPLTRSLTVPLQQFFRTSREAMYITSREGLILAANQALGDLLGYRGDELAGLTVGRILDPDEDRGRYQALVESQGVVHGYPVVMRRKDGTAIPSLVDAIAWLEAGSIVGYTGLVRPRDALAQLAPVRAAGAPPPGSGRIEVTILFFDIRGSTAIAEQCEPEAFAGFLSEILADIMDLVCGCHGSVNKLLGDGLLAVFGAPVATGNHACNAVEAATRIRDYLATFNDVRPDFLKEPVKAGIGLASGPVFAGLIGSVHRQEYTVLGDAVNLASRLQALTKNLDETILMDEATALAVDGSFACQALYKGRVRGRTEAVRIYGIGGGAVACPDPDRGA